jgi:hypothetical protein
LAGDRVRLTLDRGAYLDAQPYYTVAVLRADGYRSKTVRYTPFRDRAEQLFEQLREAVSDVAERPRACRRHRPVWRLACPRCNPQAAPEPGALPENWPSIRAGVLKRDGRRCKHCGSRERLTVHHITPRPVGTHDPKNLVTLCATCHDALELPAEIGTA